MKTLFELGTIQKNGSEESVLLLELGDSYCLLSVCNQESKQVKGLSVYTFEPYELDESLEQIINNIQAAGGSFNKVVVCSAFPFSVLSPRKFHKEELSFCKLVYGDAYLHCLYDVIGEWQLVNEYALPSFVYKRLTSLAASVQFIHAYTPGLKTFNGIDTPNQISVHFISNQFRVLVKKAGQLMLMQTYTYTSPMDVVYFLLKICLEFGMSQEETGIVLSGFIQEDSALYKELYLYFLNLHFIANKQVTLPENEYPVHFFTSIHNLAACVL